MGSYDLTLIILTLALPLLWWFRDSLPFIGGKLREAVASKTHSNGSVKPSVDHGDPRDFVQKMDRAIVEFDSICCQGKRCVMFYGSQTGTAEEYALRLAKEAKSRFGISSLVSDPEEYEFNILDQVPESNVLFFVMATYGEGEPTDNSAAFMEFIMDPSVEFSKGGSTLENLHYVIFGLGNRTYAYYNEIARKLDSRLTELGAKRVGERGEGDDDKSMEEDYLAWKDGMWESFSSTMGVEEGGAGDVPDFSVTEVNAHPADKVYHGELSPRALIASASGSNTPIGSYDSKNPFPAPVLTSKELFAVGGDRNCVHIEFDITGSGMSYQHGDHVGVWPSNPDKEVDRFLSVLGLAGEDHRHAIVSIESLDPALAKVPFPTPATYEAIFRHYLDISAIASRQTIAFLARYAPTDQARDRLTRWGSSKEIYADEIDGPALKLGEVLQAAVGDEVDGEAPFNSTVWPIPFDRIVSLVPRLGPRYYSISSSSKLYPSSIHVTAVVLKYQTTPSFAHKRMPRWVFGLSTNFILNVRIASSGTNTPVEDHSLSNGVGTLGGESPSAVSLAKMPKYKLGGPRGHYIKENVYKVPIHVRRSTFRLPTSPKVPVIMIGPGTGVAPFRGFIQERVALARKAKEKNGPDALKDWAPIHLFYGCRREHEDYLYAEEWPQYAEELDGKFNIHVAFSREMKKPDGSKVYVQDLIHDLRADLAKLILDKRAYIYICGDAKSMQKSVEEELKIMLGEAKGGSAQVEGVKEFKLLKDRNRLMTDVWS
ncbi:electron transporter [Kockovaella imperatae]|uniref:NADPH--cytochrome P450 reductase n=1 Tax=Kockovaella imperatae TaxID=4999 RepID=A0A1Y1UA74_9TREE|nr:electron transporter [Kockovaella imperatae]ORX34417.1 electron transporter [Kockovaella imperatae]